MSDDRSVDIDVPAIERKYMIERQYMEETPETKTWTVGPVGNHGAVTMTLRLPEVTITDAAGRSIVVAPKQAIGGRLTDTAAWALELTEADDD